MNSNLQGYNEGLKTSKEVYGEYFLILSMYTLFFISIRVNWVEAQYT